MGQEQELKHWPINWQSRNNTLYQVLFYSSVSLSSIRWWPWTTNFSCCVYIFLSQSIYNTGVEHIFRKECISFVAPQNQPEACCVIDMEIMLCNTLRSRREKQFILWVTYLETLLALPLKKPTGTMFTYSLYDRGLIVIRSRSVSFASFMKRV